MKSNTPLAASLQLHYPVWIADYQHEPTAEPEEETKRKTSLIMQPIRVEGYTEIYIPPASQARPRGVEHASKNVQRKITCSGIASSLKKLSGESRGDLIRKK